MYANALFGGQILQSVFNSNGGNFWVDLIARFDLVDGYMQPQAGSLVYYLTPPRGIPAVFEDPVRAVIYGIILIALCAGFSSLWIEVAGLTPRDVSRQLVNSGVVIPGFRRSPARYRRYGSVSSGGGECRRGTPRRASPRNGL